MAGLPADRTGSAWRVQVPARSAITVPAMTENTVHRMNRRCALAGIGLVATGCATLSRALAAASPAQVESPDALERFVRLRSSPSHAPVMWLFDGVLLAMPEGRVAQPLLRSSGISLTHVLLRGPGVYDFRLEEVGYFRDLASGDVLERWTNPLNGRVVQPRNYRTPERLELRADGPRGVSTPPGIEVRGQLTTLADVAGIVAMAEDLFVSVPATPAVAATAVAAARDARPARHLASLGTYTASTRDLQQPDDRWVDCQLSYATMNSFADWLQLGGMPGMQNLRLAGRKLPHTDLDAIPVWLRERLAREHPTFLQLPGAWLRAGLDLATPALRKAP